MTKKNILLIEKNPINQIITKKFLEKLGHQYSIYDDTQDLNTVVNNFDLILLNSKNNRNSGFKNIEKPIIGLLDNNSESEKGTLKELGINNFLVRPFSINHLKKHIEDSLIDLSSEMNIESENTSFDQAALDNLREAFGEDGIKDLINVYLETFDETVNSIIKKIETKNKDEASSIAHSLKSSTISLGGLELGELCKKIEYNTDEDPIDSDTIAELKDKSLEFKKYLEEILNT